MSGFFQGGFAEGARASDELAQRDRQLDISEAVARTGNTRAMLELREQKEAQRRAVREQVVAQIDTTANTAAEIVKNFDAQIAATSDPASREKLIGKREDTLNRFQKQATAIAERAAALGLPVVPQHVANRFEILRTAPTVGQQQAAAALEATRTAETEARAQVAGARAIGEAAGIPERDALVAAGLAPKPEKSIGQRAAEERTLARARSEGTAAGGNVQLRTFQMPDGSFQSHEANNRPAIREALGRGGVEVPVSVVSDSGAGLTDSDTSKIVREFTDLTASSRTLMNEIDRMKTQVSDDDTFTSVAGGVVQGLSGAVGSLVQIAKASGFEDADLLNASQYQDEIKSLFGESAAKSAQLRSNLVNVAYMMARASEPGGRLSDSDVRLQMRRLAVSGDKTQMIGALDEVARAARDAVRIRHQTFSETGVPLPPLPDDFAPSGEIKEVRAEDGTVLRFEKVPGGWRRVQ